MATLKLLLEKICASSPFRQSHRLQRFLRYASEWAVVRPNEALKEYAVAIAVYDKPPSFDPQSDPIVRVEAGRLRTRLHEYYAGPGQNDDLIIEFPKGSYLPTFQMRTPGAHPPTGESLAVIPLHDSSDADLTYLVEGVSEAVTCRLAQMLKLRVAPWSMVLRTKEPLQDLEKTAKILGVRTLVTLKLAVRGDLYELSAEWLDPAEKTHLWGGRYSRRLAELYGLEDDISFDLAGRLSPESGAMPAAELRKPPTTNGRAYQLYLKGRHLWNKRTADALVKATEYYRRALEHDASFGLALAGIADSYLTLASFAFIPPQNSLPQAKAAAAKALKIDNRLGEAQTVLACVSALYEWNWPQAQRQFQEALTLSPQYPILHQWYGACLCARREFAAGKKLLRSALELDPFSPMIGTQLAVGYYVEHRYPEAIRQCKSVLENEAHFWAALLFLGLCHVATGHANAALDALQSAVAYSGDTPMAVAALGHALAWFGKKHEAEQLRSRLESRSAAEYVPPFWLMLLCCGLGERDQALAYLEQAGRERSPSLPFWMGCEPRLDPLRNEPRFQQLLQQVGLSDAPHGSPSRLRQTPR